MSLAVVGRITEITAHPSADRLELLRIAYPRWEPRDPGIAGVVVTLVSGKHYRAGDLGVLFLPGAVLPAWLARQLWLPVVDGRFLVRDIEFMGVSSPGVWAGEWYRNDKEVPSRLNSKARAQGADREVDGWLHWGPFQDAWTPGRHVDGALEVTT